MSFLMAHAMGSDDLVKSFDVLRAGYSFTEFHKYRYHKALFALVQEKKGNIVKAAMQNNKLKKVSPPLRS